jgi:hypothetical protein
MQTWWRFWPLGGRAALAPFYVATLKFEFVGKMPHRLWVSARGAKGSNANCRGFLRPFDRLPRDDLHHRLSTLFISPSGPCRIDMEQISMRQFTLDQIPDLMQAALRFTCVVVVEITIEGDHALVHRKAVHTRHASDPVVSTTLRGSEIQSWIAEPAYYKSLAVNLDNA